MPKRENTQSGPNVFYFIRMRVGKKWAFPAVGRPGQLTSA
jgi:hypothetical protein